MRTSTRPGRRDLLRAFSALALARCAPPSSALPPQAQPSAALPPPPPDAKGKKRILMLGGTGFAGPPIVRDALARGHAVTLFNRGKTRPGLFPSVETILGDRMTELERLKGREWDAVIDTWAPGPTLVRRAAELLRDHVGHYVFLSTISVYKLGREPIDEASPTLPLPAGFQVGTVVKTIPPEAYGPLKALAEQAAETAMPGRVTSVRSGVIVGPDDPSDRFTYWPLRAARGGQMIVPAPRDANRMQLIDVRDLGAWIVTAAEQRHAGVYNAVGPDDPSLGAVIDGVRAGVGSNAAAAVWVDEAWLEKNKAGGWEDFPLCVASTDEQAGFGHVSAAKAIAKGLRFRPVSDTTRDTLAWWNHEPEERRAKKRVGIAPEREAELLARWQKSGA